MKRFLTAAALTLSLCAPAAAFTNADLVACSNAMGTASVIGPAAAEEYKQTHKDLYDSNPLKWSRQWDGFFDRMEYAERVINAAEEDMLNGGDDVDCSSLLQKLTPYIRGERQ